MSGVSFEVITATERLEAIAPDWRGLWERCPAALPFQSPAWLIPWWRHFAPGPLFTLAAWRGPELVGLAPGYLEDGALGRRILPLGISLSDHLDILVGRADRDAALAALVAAALSRAADWDFWELEELLPDAAALELPLPEGCADTVEPQTACPFIAVPPGASLTDLMPRTQRRHLNLARNRTARRGLVEIERSDAATAIESLRRLFRLHRMRWATRGEVGVLAADRVQAFQLDAVPRLQDDGLLRIYTLSIGGAVAAAHYELLGRDRVFVYLTGFDPAFDHESPGTVLLAHAMQQAIAEGRSEIDFLRGREPYKYGWGAVDRWNVKRSIRQVAGE